MRLRFAVEMWLLSVRARDRCCGVFNSIRQGSVREEMLMENMTGIKADLGGKLSRTFILRVPKTLLKDMKIKGESECYK